MDNGFLGADKESPVWVASISMESKIPAHVVWGKSGKKESILGSPLALGRTIHITTYLWFTFFVMA